VKKRFRYLLAILGVNASLLLSFIWNELLPEFEPMVFPYSKHMGLVLIVTLLTTLGIYYFDLTEE